MLYDVNVSSNALDRYWWCTLKKLLLQPLLRIDRACVVYRAWYNLLQSICPLLSYATDISVSAQGVMYIGLMPKLFRWEIATTFYIGVTFLKKKKTDKQNKVMSITGGKGCAILDACCKCKITFDFLLFMSPSLRLTRYVSAHHINGWNFFVISSFPNGKLLSFRNMNQGIEAIVHRHISFQVVASCCHLLFLLSGHWVGEGYYLWA